MNEVLSTLEETILEDDHLDYNLVGSWYFTKLAQAGLDRWLKDA